MDRAESSSQNPSRLRLARYRASTPRPGRPKNASRSSRRQWRARRLQSGGIELAKPCYAGPPDHDLRCATSSRQILGRSHPLQEPDHKPDDIRERMRLGYAPRNEDTVRWQRILNGRAGGWGREKGRAERDPALLSCFSLIGIDAVPPRESAGGLRRQRRPRWGRGLQHICLRFAGQFASSRCSSVQSSGRSSSVRRDAVSSTGCRPSRTASTRFGVRKARLTRRRM